jgi:hypothetical protein
MRRIVLAISLTACVAGMLATAVWAQASRPQEPLSAWLYFKEVQVPRNQTGWLDFVLDREMLGAARTDHADVRLYDASNKEIPYVLRVRREIDSSYAFTAREFNRGSEGGASLVSYDLGELPQEHNEVEVETEGNDFRRLVDVQGSADGNQWSTLVAGGILFRFSAAGKTVEQRAVAYPVSRYRYLRVRVERDSQVDHATPVVKTVQVRRSVKVKGELATFRGTLEGRDPDRIGGRPASVWRVDFGAYIPLERVAITVGDAEFARPFQLEAIDDPTAPVMLASGELVRRGDALDRRPTIEFPEHFARRVRLTVTDDRNTALSIVGMDGLSAARQVVFNASGASAGPIRAYYGNPKALPPRYDLAARMPADLQPPPMRLTPGPQRDNPIYSPEPRPLSERLPWLVYVVLATAGVVLAAILLSLVRRSAAEVSAG